MNTLRVYSKLGKVKTKFVGGVTIRLMGLQHFEDLLYIPIENYI